MAWVDPIFDRSEADIVNKTSKAYFNVADWQRIHSNTEYLRVSFSTLRGVSVSLITLVEPTIATIPTSEDLNQLIENIDLLRQGSMLPSGVLIEELNFDFADGQNVVSPTYEDVNTWELALSQMKVLNEAAADYLVRCGVGNTGQSRSWQHRYR